MEFTSGHTGRRNEISELFVTTFTASEGAEEGRIVGALVDGLMATTPAKDVFSFCSYEDQTLVGCIFFSRLKYKMDERLVFILSPVAVATKWQKQGVGQKLIAYGLDTLRQEGIDVVMTYGDPNYYSKSGFQQVGEETANAPLRLSHPHGWQAKSLTTAELIPLAGICQCVEALNKPELW